MSETDPKNKLFAGFLQFDVRSGDIPANLSRVEAGLAEIAAAGRSISGSIVALPELWATGFAYDRLAGLAADIPDLLKILQNLAAKHLVLIAGSMPEYTGGVYYNTLYITGPAGTLGAYRKQRLFSPMQEDSFFTSDLEEPQPVRTDLGPVGGLVCYDLRFPELLRSQAGQGADIAVVSAQWPAARLEHWRILLRARAIENQMFVIGANRCGTTGDTSFGGHSMIIAPDGTILLEAGDREEFGGVVLDRAMLSTARTLFRTVPDRRI